MQSERKASTNHRLITGVSASPGNQTQPNSSELAEAALTHPCCRSAACGSCRLPGGDLLGRQSQA